jgi:hypothetical protein
MSEEVDCSEAYKNPSCPYVTQININTACMKQVDKALISLLGKDGTGLNDGVIHRMLRNWSRQGLNTCVTLVN